MPDESLEEKIARIDERTGIMLDKLNDHCKWKEQAGKDLEVLTKANLPGRTASLENWRSGLAMCLGLVAILLAWGWLKPVFP